MKCRKRKRVIPVSECAMCDSYSLKFEGMQSFEGFSSHVLKNRVFCKYTSLFVKIREIADYSV